MILSLLGILGWPLGLFFAGVSVSVLFRIAHGPKHPVTGRRMRMAADQGAWITALMFACAAIADFTALGLLPVLTGAVLAGLVLAAFLALAQPWRPGVHRSLRSNAAIGARWLRGDVRSVLGHARGADRLAGLAGRMWRRLRRGGPDGGPVPPGPAGPGEELARRPVPSIREDAELGPAPAPEEIAAAGTAIPAGWAMLASEIASREPESDTALHACIRGDAAGLLAVAQAYEAHGDHLLNGVGLDPAVVAAVCEFAGTFVTAAGDGALVDRRLTQVYAEITEWHERTGRPLPFNARQWFGDGAAA